MNRLFSPLKDWQKGSSLNKDPACDSLALICLRITSALLNDDKEPQRIAKQLSLVLDGYKKQDINQELFKSMSLVDQSVDKNLAGFCGLLDWVLSEHRVRRDPSTMLKKVVGVDRGIINSFKQLSLMLETYFNLKASFVIKAPKATTVMFLLTLAKIYDVIYGPKKGASIIFRWLKERVKNDEIANLYHGWFLFKDFFVSKELLVLAICRKAARGEKVKAGEAALFDKALGKAFTLGLKPLVESGFLMLESASKFSGTNKVLKGLYIASGKFNGQSAKTS